MSVDRERFHAFVLQSTGASTIEKFQVIQSLWSGYGSIQRIWLSGGSQRSVVLKHIAPPKQTEHPRGWNTDASHQRKLDSYRNEIVWYRDWNARCGGACRVPRCIAITEDDGENAIVLEDLDDAGYPRRRSHLQPDEVAVCLQWLAAFHARFLTKVPSPGEHSAFGELFPVGTYWHLETRRDEYDAMDDGPLKSAAAAIDRTLNGCHYQTLVHGDAKVANFCFRTDMMATAAVDFQYVGGGCGIKDVAYLLGSCLTEVECERYESELLAEYFRSLRGSLREHNTVISDTADFPTDVDATDADAIEREWRELFPLAWADFTRFMLGWCPTHKKLNAYTQKVTQKVLRNLGYASSD